MTSPTVAVNARLSPSWGFGGATRSVYRRMAADVADFYRLRQFRTLVPGQRALVYTAFGSAMGGPFQWRLIVANVALIALLFMFFGAYDNYWDWKLMGEQNGTRAVMERRRWPAAAGLLLAFMPWLLILPLAGTMRAWGLSWSSERLIWVLALLGAAYMTPGIRLKSRRLSFFMAPAWACLLFLQAAFLSGTGRYHLMLFALSGAIFALQCQAELLHRLDDGVATTAAPALRGWLYRLPWIALGVSLAAAWRMPLLLNSTVWWLVRLWALRRVNLARLSSLRRQVWHPVWSLYEFGIYAAVGMAHRFV